MMVAGACGRSGWLVTSWQPGSRGSTREGADVSLSPSRTHCHDPLPPTRPRPLKFALALPNSTTSWGPILQHRSLWGTYPNRYTSIVGYLCIAIFKTYIFLIENFETYKKMEVNSSHLHIGEEWPLQYCVTYLPRTQPRT